MRAAGRALGALVGAALAAACASAPTKDSDVRAASAEDERFVACVAPYRVEVARGEAGEAIVRPLGATPREVAGLAAAADHCGAWALDPDAAPHVRALLEHERCGDLCPAGWEGALARAMAKAPTSATRCEVAPDTSWADWARAALLEGPGLDAEAWVERALALGRAGIGTAEAHIEARLQASDPDDAAAVARAALARLPFGAESMRFAAAMSLVGAGDLAGGRNWLNQIAQTGRTAFRTFARVELERLDAASEAPR